MKLKLNLQIIIFFTIIFSVSSCIMQEPERFDETKSPEPCFQNAETFDKCVDYDLPLPSDYILSAFPENSPISLKFPSSMPLSIRFSSPIDEISLSEGLHVIRTKESVSEILDKSKYLVQLGQLNPQTFEFSDDKTFLNIIALDENKTPASWDEQYSYMVVLSKELRDINGLAYASPAAFFMASSTFEINEEIVKALYPGMTDEEAKVAIAAISEMRKGLIKPFEIIEEVLAKNKFDISFLWSFKFNGKSVCFQSTDVKNCENNPLPIPSDLTQMALPAGTDLNISPKSNFSINFSDEISIDTFIENLIIVKKPIFTEEEPQIINNEDLDIKIDDTDIRKVTIKNKTGDWDSGFTYIMYLKNGVKSNNVDVLPAFAFFLALQENSLLKQNDEGDILVGDLLISLQIEDLALAQMLEALRLINNDLIALANAMGFLERKDLLMAWTVTIKENIILPCFNSPDFPGCENASDAPLPSDFIMKDGLLNLPIKEDDSDMMKGMLTALNTLDGWSTVKPFNITLSATIDESTLTAQDIIVLKISDKNGPITEPIPVGIITSFNNETNKLEIKPLMRKWDESSTYVVVLTNNIKGENQEALVKPIGFSFMMQENSLLNEDGSSKYAALTNEIANFMEAARLQFKPGLDLLGTVGYTRDKIVMMWTVTTQTVTDEIKTMREFVLNNPAFTDEIKLDITKIIDKDQFDQVFPGVELKDVSFIAYGSFKAPMLLSSLDSPYMGAFNPNYFPANAETPATENAELVDIPFLVAFPKPKNEDPKPVANNEVIIFQHGFNRQKEDVIAILNPLIKDKYIVVSYDLPFHGERTLADANTGDGFVSLNVFATRDNIRQAVLEQVKLIKLLKTVDFSALDTTNHIEYSTIDPNNIYYIGHSMGTLVGNILISIEDSINKGVLNVAGAHFTKMIMSTTEDIKSPLINSLAALGILEGTPEFEQFLYLAQVAMEKADSINYTSGTDNILIQEALSDPVISNEVTRELGISQGFISSTDNTIIKPNNYKRYDVNTSVDTIHSFLLLDTDKTDEAIADILDFIK